MIVEFSSPFWYELSSAAVSADFLWFFLSLKFRQQTLLTNGLTKEIGGEQGWSKGDFAVYKAFSIRPKTIKCCGSRYPTVPNTFF